MICYLLLTLFFILCQGFFSGMETGMVSVLRPRAEHSARKGSLLAKIMLYFLYRPEIMISTALVGVNVSVVLASLMAKELLLSMGISGGIGMTLGSIILSIIMLGCEILPKNWFREAAFVRCRIFIPIFGLFYVICCLPIRIFSWFSHALNTLIGKVSKQNLSAESAAREDFRLYLRESRTCGAVDEDTTFILDRALDVPAMLIGKIIIPRSKVPAIPEKMTIRQAFRFCQEHNLTKAPVSDGAEWIGVFDIYDAIYAVDEEQWEEHEVTFCMSPLYTIRINLMMGELLEQLRYRRVSFLTVVDKKQKQIGIVRPEDLAALIFGK